MNHQTTPRAPGRHDARPHYAALKIMTAKPGLKIVLFRGIFFYMDVKGNYVPARKTITEGTLPDFTGEWDWIRIHKPKRIAVLSDFEKKRAETITALLRIFPYLGLTPEQVVIIEAWKKAHPSNAQSKCAKKKHFKELNVDLHTSEDEHTISVRKDGAAVIVQGNFDPATNNLGHMLRLAGVNVQVV